MPKVQLLRAVDAAFEGRDDVIRMNRQAVAIAYRFARDNLEPQGAGIPVAEGAAERLLVNATQSVALGKLAAGIGFQSYYPISPATDESTYLEGRAEVTLTTGETAGPLILQVEDELAAVNMASGAALTGARSATSTSGPGFSLMAEGLGWAGMNEVPLVVTLYQRGGPSTGMPTRTDQGDLLFALHGGHGEFPRIVLASGDVASCFYDAARAFDYAERYQLPVIHLLDKALTSTLQTVPLFDPAGLTIDRGELFTPPAQGDGRERFKLTPSGISPRPLLGQVDGRHWITGVEHSEQGQVTEDPVLRERMMEKRARKLELAAAAIPLIEKFEILGDAEAAFTLFTWGSNKGAVIDVLGRLSDAGISARAVQLRLLCPFPADALRPWLESASPSVMVENNYSGQLNTVLQQHLGSGCDYLVLKYSGRPVSGEALFPVLLAIHAGEAEARIVLHNDCE
jgi:2-oxoglutarate ferredoxin oxidoreductase subunit alpha